MAGGAIDPSRLDVLRALADPTRNALYRELQRSSGPLTTPELAARVSLHPNTVRGHLDQLCAVGLVRADTAGHGGRGRPRHRFSAVPGTAVPDLDVAADDDARSAEPAGVGLARALVRVAEAAGVDAETIRSVGRRGGHDRAAAAPVPASLPDALRRVVEAEARDGYGPVLDQVDADRWRVTFSTCPHRELAEGAPEVVCSLHAGSVEGMCGATGRLQVESFTVASGGEVCHAVLRACPDDRSPRAG